MVLPAAIEPYLPQRIGMLPSGCPARNFGGIRHPKSDASLRPTSRTHVRDGMDDLVGEAVVGAVDVAPLVAVQESRHLVDDYAC